MSPRPSNEWMKEFFTNEPTSVKGWGGHRAKEWMGFDRDPDQRQLDKKLHELAVEYGLTHNLTAYNELRDYVQDKYDVFLDDIDWDAFAEWYEGYLSWG